MSKNCFIYETLNEVKKMDIKRSDEGLITLSGVFGVCGVRNNNKRVYETSNYSKMVDEMKERIANEGGIPGELEHPQMMNITLENVSHKITDINIDESGTVTGTIALLNTPKGQIAQAIVEGGLPLFISSRATGNVDSKTGNVTLERIATYDLVGSPGFSQAKLHLNENQIVESIDEGMFYIAETENLDENTLNENTEDNMNMDELLSKFEALETRVQVLEEKNNELQEANQQLQEANEELEEKVEEQAQAKFDENLKKIAEGIQNWIVNEYSPVIQNWILEEFADEHKEEILEEIDFNQEGKQEELLEGIQNWVVNEYSEGIQKWVVEEFSPEVENWIKESYEPTLVQTVQESIQDTVSTQLNESKQNNLNAIDETLQLLEGLDVTKPTYSRKSLITENADEPQFIQEMPAEARVKWDMASQEVKESITRRAKLYNFTNEGAIERFWESINFDEVKPSNTIYEGLENIEDERERAIRAQLRGWKSRRK